MKITYLGTGAAEGVPALFCNCDTCRTVRALGGREIRSRTQILVDGNLGIDFPPDAYYHALRFGADLSAVESLFITHSHMDHFYAHDFILRGYKYAAGMAAEKLHIYGNAEVCKVFAECTRREMRADVQEGMTMSEIKPFSVTRASGYAVTAFPAAHSRTEEALLFLVEREGKGYLHLHDTGMPPASVFAYLKEKGKRVQLVSLDCTLADRHSSSSGRHMGIEENAQVMRRLRADGVADGDTRFVITHFSHNSAPFTSRLRALEEEYGVIAAYDGMTLEV